MAHNRDSVKRFFPAFCTLQKAGKMPPQGGGKSTRSVPSRQGHRRRRQKDLIGLMRSCCLGVLIRGLQNLESPCWKGFNFVRAKPPLRRAEPRFEELRSFPARERVYSFRLYEKNQKYPRGLRTSGLRGRFKALSKKISAKFSGGTSRTRLFAQNGGEKALNRCDVPVLQREDLERTTKEWPCSLVDSRLWLGGNLWCLE